MKAYLDCFPCFMRQALEAARMATDDPALQRAALDRVARLLPTVPMGTTPVEIGQLVHRAVREVTGVPDPYAAVKRESNDLGLRLYPEFKGWVEGSPDPLLAAIKIAGAGNVIDFGANTADGSVERMAEDSFSRALDEPLDAAQYRAFVERLAEVDRVLYLGDNAGEIVCDRILVEELVRRGKEVTFVTRGAPTINDATMADARYVGLDAIATVIANGSDAPGTLPPDCSHEFLTEFRRAELIIAKGQGNFEGLSDVPGPIFFLFKVKCPVIAREAGAPLGTVILREQVREGMTE
ncbi:hypothetical protein DRJ23_04425 [Candidatus Acetothermia bacterium]|nr:MAG: hypothetical protein DRJ23_04425 [Candidatus Acetothermia bacterium]